jgi:nicotinamidase-related amidase
MTNASVLLRSPALVVVDVQNYYLLPESDFQRFHETVHPGSLDYIGERCRETVLPGIARLLSEFRSRKYPIFFLRLCGREVDRADLHPFFREAWAAGVEAGFADVYPLSGSVMADVVDEIRPGDGDVVFDKTTFSAFTGGDAFAELLRKEAVRTLVFTGLATSQCVDTTARDASDRGFGVLHVPDAQADYSEEMHHAALYSSQGVCGGAFLNTNELIRLLDE